MFDNIQAIGQAAQQVSALFAGLNALLAGFVTQQIGFVTWIDEDGLKLFTAVPKPVVKPAGKRRSKKRSKR